MNYSKYILLALLIFLISCSENEIQKRCAFVHIVNPNTENESMSDLYVEISQNKVVKIYWDNGGWLDISHFDPNDAYLDDKGYTSFTDDRGRDFGILLQDEAACEFWSN